MVVSKRPIKDRYLEALCESVEHATPDWERIDKQLTIRYNLPPESRDNLGHVKGRAAECITYNAFEAVREKYPDRIRIGIEQSKEVNPERLAVPDKLGSVKVYNTAEKCVINEIDMVTRTLHPTVWEIKSGTFRNKRGKTRDGIKQKSVNMRSAPIKAYFETHGVRSATILPKDMIDPQKYETQLEFISRGGLLVPFYTTHEQYEQEVRENLMS